MLQDALPSELMDLKHHWKNRINDIVLCIIVPIDSKYGSGKYRHLGRQTIRKKGKVTKDEEKEENFALNFFRPSLRYRKDFQSFPPKVTFLFSLVQSANLFFPCSDEIT